jgi:hypothetical protein
MPHHKYPKIALYCLACLMLAFFASNRLFRGDLAGWKLIISSDGLGYYSYLPALLIDHDLAYQKVTEREKKILRYERYEPSYLVKTGNRFVNKYFAGEALLLVPFFLIATFFSWVGGIEITGYSFFYQLLAGLGALFYLFAGLYYLKKILNYIKIQPILSSIILVVILLGTNLFYYSMWQPSMSHVYSFFAINGFLWYCCSVIKNPGLKNFTLAGLFFGIVILIRPTNGIVLLLIPFLFNTKEEIGVLKGFISKNKFPLLFGLGVFLLVISIQVILWYLQTGKLIIWSYKDEGFSFGHPRIISVLFGYRKGLFVYTPLIFLSLFGCFRLFRKNLTRLITMSSFIIVSSYIIASWWNWYYGDGFGARAFIDYYGIYALLLAILLNHKESKTGTILVIALLFPFVALNLLQTWQYTHYIIHPYSMNKAKYEYVFLKTDSVYQKCLGGNDEIPGYTMNMAQPCILYKTDFEKTTDPWRRPYNRNASFAHSGQFIGYLDSLHPYSVTLEIKPEGLSPYPAIFYIEGSVWIRDSIKGSSNGAFFVFSVDSLDQIGNYYYNFPVNDIPDNPDRVWRECKFSLTLPEFRTPGRLLKIYIWNNGKKPFMIDDFSVAFYCVKKKREK